MHILYLHQYFKTPEEGGAIRSFHIAKVMVQKGHKVSLITSHNQPHKKYQNIEGIDIYYLPVFYENRLSSRQRIWAFFRFLLLAYRQSLKISNINLCYATSTPLSIGLLALLLKRWKKIPFVFEVRDLWPLAPIQLGVIQSKLLQKVLFSFEQKLYKEAQKVISLSKGSKEYIEQYVSSSKVILAPNMSDCSFFRRVERESTEPFIISYLGTLGKANDVFSLVEMAKVSQEKELNIEFWIVGEGSEKEELIQKSNKLSNVKFLDTGNKEYIRNILNQSDATHTSFAQFPVLETNSPNKFFDSLASGKLTIVNTKGWLRELVEENQCGFYVENSQDFIKKISPFLENTPLLTQYQQNARNLAEKEFDKNLIVSRILVGIML
ncbi:MAG: glycosyltransferase family 4 protein [Cytophagales bacterium]|nr:glycosyltransferase family 4 protein [Cytophagales bacterium]